MYQIRDDQVVPLSSVPSPDPGAPLPVVLASDYRLVLVYFVLEPDPSWDGSKVQVVSHQSPDRPVAVVRFQRPYTHGFGAPNDESLSGHPLASRGLQPYTVCEVLKSSWIRELDQASSVHPEHRSEEFLAYRHFIFAFHDSTFECVARGIQIELSRGSVAGAVALASSELCGDAA
jgi:hypothetical protein